ncbi:MAG TPA: GxxExxY protein, partial [Gemmatimonadales bacterium]|nr:GxxExxY protein [Gemmatimonadales bacterium]
KLTDTTRPGERSHVACDCTKRNGPQMNADERRFKHQTLTRQVIGVFFEVYNELGYGFLESVYREAMCIALRTRELDVLAEFPLAALFRGQIIGRFKVDLVVNGTILIELKAARTLDSAHEAQTLNYLRAGVLEVALLLNFGPKPQFKRLAFSNERKGSLVRSLMETASRLDLRSSALICGSKTLPLNGEGEVSAFSLAPPD